MLNLKEVSEYSRNFADRHVLVIGDLMLDEYVWGHVERISPEAPVPILKIVRREYSLGGAGNVVHNLRALGVKVTAIGVLGQDDAGTHVLDAIERLGVSTETIVPEPTRNSTRKVRLMSLEHGQQVFRFDEETAQEVPEHIEDQLIAQIVAAGACADVILCADYLKGTLTARVLKAVFETGQKRGIVTLVGPKDPNPEKYRGAKILMPNQRELAQLTQTSIDGNCWLMDSAEQLIGNLGLEALVVTRGRDGMSLFEATGNVPRRVDIPTMARSVFDVTGAGDTAISVLAATMVTGASLEFAVHLANLAAGIKVAKRGTNSVTISEIHRHLSDAPLQ